MMQKLSRFLLISLCVEIGALHAVPANSVVATINVGVTPTATAFTPDGRTAYVVNNNNYTIAGEDNLTVVDVATSLPIGTINDASFNEPWRMAINAAGTKGYICNSNACTVSVLDIATGVVTNVISGFDGPSGIVLTPDGNFAYVNNYGAPCGVGSGNATTVRVVDLNTNAIVGAPIVVGLAPASLAITPNGAYVYVANYTVGNPGTGTVSKIRTSDNTVVATIPGFSGPFVIAITPNGKFAYVSNFGSNNFAPFGSTVSVIDLSTDTIVDTINVGIQPAGLAITPDGRYVYVSNYNTLYAGAMFTNLTPGQGTVNIIDTATNTVLPPTIEVNQSPNGIAIAPNGLYAYVTNFISNTVNVVALQTFQLAVTGCRTHNIFLTHEDFVNQLTITATGSYLPIEYSVYRDAGLTDLAGTVPATSNPFVFYDHNRNPNVVNTYYVVGTNVAGTTSSPVVVTVAQNC
jgi:YVTN family beta-propeller protein